MYVRCDESVIVFPDYYLHSSDLRNFSAESGIIGIDVFTGFSAYTYCIMPTPRC